MKNVKNAKTVNKIDTTKFKQITFDLKILAEKHRLEILNLLKTGKSKSVGQIADHLNISFKATSKHLLYFAKKGILKRRYDGPFVLYKISDNLPRVARLIIFHLL